MRIAITGAAGLVGHELTPVLEQAGHEVLGLDKAAVDITDHDAVRRVVPELGPDVIINAAVIVSVDNCERDPAMAYAVNRDGVKNLLNACQNLTTAPIFVHISSSEVFGRCLTGQPKVNGYREDDTPQPENVYQKSKTEAEAIVRTFAARNPKTLKSWYVVRASWLFGQGRKIFVDQFAEAIREREEIVVADDQWRSPTWTRDFSNALADLISSGRENGIYHIVNEVAPGEATVMDVIEEIRNYFGIPPGDVHAKRVKLRDFFKVPRAPSNVLLNTKLPKLRPWREALREYLMVRYPR